MTPEQEIERAKALLKQNGYRVYPGRRVFAGDINEIISCVHLCKPEVDVFVEHVKRGLAMHIGGLLYKNKAIAWSERMRGNDLHLRGDVRVIVPKPLIPPMSAEER